MSKELFDSENIFKSLLQMQLEQEEQGYSHALIAWEQHVEKQQEIYKELSRKYYNKIENAIQLIAKYFENDMIELAKFQQEESEEIEESESLEVKLEALQMIYALGISNYEEHKYKEAADIFFFILQFQPLSHTAWMMLGLSSQMNQNYEEAIKAHFQATLLNIELPHPFLYLAQCLHHENDHEAAQYYVDSVLKNTQWESEFPEEYQSAQALNKLIKGNK